MSGWTTATINVSDEDVREEIDTKLSEQYDGRDPWTADGYAKCTVQVGRHASHSGVAKDLAEEFPRAEYIAVVSANDTSDSGHGTLFRVTLTVDGETDDRFTKHPVKEIDSMSGYEGARGSDVTGYFREEHGIKSYETWEA